MPRTSDGPRAAANFPRPATTVDVVIFTVRDDTRRVLAGSPAVRSGRTLPG